MVTVRRIVMLRAQPRDLAAVLAVFEDVRAWMISRGVNTWRPIARWRDLIARKIARQDGFPIALYEKRIS